MKDRDAHRCKLCNVLDNRKPYPAHNLEVHHIRRWHDSPALRFVVSNGITLCKSCHSVVTGREVAFAAALKKLIK